MLKIFNCTGMREMKLVLKILFIYQNFDFILYNKKKSVINSNMISNNMYKYFFCFPYTHGVI